MEEPPALGDIDANQSFPTRPRPIAARGDRDAVCDLKHRAEEVENRDIILQFANWGGGSQCLGGRTVQVVHRNVKPRQARIVNERVKEVILRPPSTT